MIRNPPLPIDNLLPDILNSLKVCRNLVIEAAAGAGKTTRVPIALLQSAIGKVVVLEPRRIAARLAAKRVAWEMGEQVGETVGYQVRFDEAIGPRTRLSFVTEGILTRRMLSDPRLEAVDVVVLDEFHERHLESDLALALLKRLQEQRAELKLVVMSATLDAGPVAHFLGDCPVIRSAGRMFPLSIRFQPYSPDALEAQVRRSVELLIASEHTGDILVFLPGAAEIRRASRECTAVAERTGLLIVPLHGDLTPAEQDRAVAPGQQRKLILATNVAESSVTIDGVTAVIDSGLSRTATTSPWTGLPTLTVGRISKASARQRAGRAGRTGPGTVIRLYPEEDFSLRTDFDTPEILRSDLSQLCLTLRALGVPDFKSLRWLDEPQDAAIVNAEVLLDRLGAVGSMARRLARFPLSPRLSRLLVEAVDRKVGTKACDAAALLSSGARSAATDLLVAVDAVHDQRTLQQAAQLRRLAPLTNRLEDSEDALLMSVLAGFPDRVARRKAGNQIALSTGLSAEILGERPAYEFMVAVEIEDRKEKALPLVRMTSRIEPEWLIELFPDRVRELSEVRWNHNQERVEAKTSLVYDELVLHEAANTNPDAEITARLLASKAREAGLDRFVDGEALEQILCRAAFADLKVPDPVALLQDLCEGLSSFAELESAAETLPQLLEQKMGVKQLRDFAPHTITLKTGRMTKIHYERGKPPWIASKLQDFFGMRETPRIGPLKTAVVVHLLAPNQRAVQTTTDLAGFWIRLYPEVRRELMRRYPRHQWPEVPGG